MTKIKSPLKHNEKPGDNHPTGQYALKPEIWEERHNAFHAEDVEVEEEKNEEVEEEQINPVAITSSKTLQDLEQEEEPVDSEDTDDESTDLDFETQQKITSTAFPDPYGVNKYTSPLIIDGEEVDLQFPHPLGNYYLNPSTDAEMYRVSFENSLNSRGMVPMTIDGQNVMAYPTEAALIQDNPSFSEESQFEDEDNDGNGNYSYNFKRDNYTGKITHLEDRSGAVDQNTFRQIVSQTEEYRNVASQGQDMEKWVSGQLTAMHKEYKDMRKTDSNPMGLDKNGYYYEFDYKNLTGDDELVMKRYDRHGQEAGTKTIELPTSWSEDDQMTWSKIYQEYDRFLNPGDENQNLTTLGEIGANWDKWATHILKEYGEGEKNINEFLQEISPNKQQLEGTTRFEQGRYRDYKVKPGSSRGGIVKQEYYWWNGYYSKGDQKPYWTLEGADGAYNTLIDLNSGNKLFPNQSKNIHKDANRFGGTGSKEDERNRIKFFYWKGEKHRYDSWSGFKPPTYNDNGDINHEGRGELVDGGHISEWEDYKYMHQDLERSRAVIEDLFYESEEIKNLKQEYQTENVIPEDYYKPQYNNHPSSMIGGTGDAITQLYSTKVGEDRGIKTKDNRELVKGNFYRRPGHGDQVFILYDFNEEGGPIFRKATPMYSLQGGSKLSDLKYVKNDPELKDKYKDKNIDVNDGYYTGADDIITATEYVEPAETDKSSKKNLSELKKENLNIIYKDTEVLDNVTHLDIMQHKMDQTNKILDSEEYTNSWFEKQKEISSDFEGQINAILEPYKEDINKQLESEFGDESREIENTINELYEKYKQEDEEELRKIIQRVTDDLAKEGNEFSDPKSQEYKEEYTRRIKELNSLYRVSVASERQKTEEGILNDLTKRITNRYNELTEPYVGPLQEEYTSLLEDEFYKHQSNFIKNAYETKSNGAEQLIPESTYNTIFKRLQDNNIHMQGYETQKEAINLEWRKLEVELDKIYDGEDGKATIDAMRDEFYMRAYEKISLDKDNRPTATGMKLWAEDVVDELSKEEDLSKAEQESLRYAKEILQTPEFMKETAVGRYFDGMFSKEFTDLIPIYAGIKEGNRKNYIRKLLEKPVEELSEDEKLTLVMFSEYEKLQAQISEKSSSYNAGRGTVDSFRFMIEMIASRGIGKIFSKGGRALVIGNRGRLANRSQEVIDRYSRITGISDKVLKIQDKAANVSSFLLGTAGMTGLGGSSMIYEQTIDRMTPEMSWSLTSDGENVALEIDKLGFYVGDDENGNPIYEQDKGWDEAFAKAFSSTWVEYATEKFGQYIPGGVKFLRKELLGDPMWLKRMVLGRYARKLGLNPASANFLNRVQRAGGWNGIIPEVMEEFIAQPFQNLIDGRGLTDGIDEDFVQEVLIQTGAMTIMFGTANRTYKYARGVKDPVYIVGDDSFSNAEDAHAAIRYAKENGLLKDLNIEISNDFYAFEEAAEILDGTGFENNLDSKNLIEIVEDRAKAIEIEAINELPKDKVEEIEKTNEKIESLQEQKKSLMKGSNKDKQKTIEEIVELDREINELTSQKHKVLDPIIGRINERVSSEEYKEKLETVKKFSEEVDGNTNVIEVSNTKETAELYEIMALNDLLVNQNIQVVKNAETGQLVYIDKNTNTTLSQKDLNQIDFGENTTFQDIKQQVRDNKDNEFDMTHGFTTPEVNGRQSIVVNKEASLKLGAKNVAAHEFLHRFLNKTFNNNPHTKLAVGRALENELKNMNPNGIRNSNFRRRLIDYQNKQDATVSAEETLTLFSDALVNGEMRYNETFSTKLGDMFRRTFSLGGKRVEFESGRDVMNFVRDYNRMIETKRMSRGMRRTMQQGARIRGEIKYGSDMYAKELIRLGLTQDSKTGEILMSKEASDKVQSIYEEQGVAGAFDIIDAFKPITGKIVERRRDVPGFDRQLLMDEIETGARGIFDLIQSYNPESGVPLAAYINTYLPSRAIEASNRILGEQFTEDITERVDIAEEAAPVEIFDQATGRKIKLSERLGPKAVAINKEVKSIAAGMDVSKLTFKTLKDLTPDMTQDMFGIIPKPGNLTKGDIKNAQMFINKHAATLVQMLPEGSTVGGTSTGVQKVLLDAFYTKSDRAKMAKTGTKAGLAIQVKNPNIETKQFLEVFGITERGKENTYKKDSNTSSRVKALVSQTGKMLSNQGVREHLLEREKSLDAIQKIADGKSRIMFSTEAKRNFNLAEKVIENETIRSEFDLGIKGIDELSTLYGQGKTYHFRTKANIDDFYREVENIWVPTLPKSLITKGVLRPSRRILPNKGESIIKVNGKEMTIDQYYTMKRDKLLAKNLKYGKDFTGAAKNFKPRVYGKYLGDTPGKINESSRSGKIKEFNKINSSMHKQLWQRINKSIRSNPKNIRVWGNYFKLVGQLSTHPHRLGAEMIGWSPKPIGKIVKGKRRLYEWEHAMPATSAYLYLLDASLSGGNFDVSYDLVMKNFKLIALDAGADLKLKSANLTTGMPKGWDLIENSWWQRYFNKEVGKQIGEDGSVGIDPASIKTIDGSNLSEQLGVNKDGNAAFVIPGSTTGMMFSKAVNNSRLINHKTPSRGMSAFDFDETLIDKGENTIIAKKGDDVVTITSGQWPIQGPQLAKAGYEFDFSDFINVRGGVEGPLMQKFRNRIDKYGIENNYILTARPAESAPAIQAWLKQQGIDMPIENITGLGNSTGEAKAVWIANKFAEGYNDIYFVDDALPNVEAVANMLDQLDIKGSSVQARIKFSKDMDKSFNDILEQTTGVESQKQFSEAQAKLRGNKGKYKGLIPASAQDFMGLLYNFIGKGKVGEQQVEFFKKALVDPFARGVNELNAAKQTSFNDLNNLFKQFKGIKKKLRKKVSGTKFTTDQAVRVYLWNKAGFEVPGLSKRDTKTLVDAVNKNSELKAFADALGIVSKKDQGYSEPGEHWLAENIQSDILSDGALGDARSKYLEEWQQNVDEIFSPKNLNKIQAIYGAKFTEALKDILYRMRTGSNRPTGSNRLTNMYMNWVNNSVGAIMFFNIRSAALQTISAVNYVNWSDNNPLKAGAAFANQPQFWKDFVFLFNSDFLKQRRKGNQRGVNESELLNAVVGSNSPAKAAIAWLLNKGFLPTQIADSFAIASGGSTFYRNRVKKYIKNGMPKSQAEQQAFLDFQEITEVSQQSARPDLISQQQANPLGRIILAFQNTPMQYGRIMNKAIRDLANRRGDTKTHLSKIVYYGAVQAIIFNALQSAVFASLGDEDEEELDEKKFRILNGMIDGWLSAFGYGGKAVGTISNTVQEFLEQRDKGFRADHGYTILRLLSFSPPIGSKARKIYSSIKTDQWNSDIFKKRGLTLDNPIWSAVGNVVEGFTNIPLGRLANKMKNLDNAMDSNLEWWKRVALLSGWNTWDLGIKDADLETLKLEIKEQKQQEKEIEREEKKRIKQEKEQKEELKIEEQNKELQKKEKKEGKKVLCAAVNKSGNRCKKEILPGQTYCTIHEKVEQNETGEKKQCKKIKSDKKRCKMKTNSKSGYCYYHD